MQGIEVKQVPLRSELFFFLSLHLNVLLFVYLSLLLAKLYPQLYIPKL